MGLACRFETEVREMLKKKQRNRRTYLSLLIIACMGIILLGGIHYISSLRVKLMDQAVHNVLTVTMQQQQAFDNFLSGDKERLHSFARYLEKCDSDDTEDINQWLNTFNEIEASYSIIDLESGKRYNNRNSDIDKVGDEELEFYRGFSGSGVRDPYKGEDTEDMMFGYYERFSFADDVSGLILKSYDRSKVSKDFSLSFYNDQGFAYVVNKSGDILLRSVGMLGDHLYANIFDILAEHDDTAKQEKMNGLQNIINSHAAYGPTTK